VITLEDKKVEVKQTVVESVNEMVKWAKDNVSSNPDRAVQELREIKYILAYIATILEVAE
jgi:hypothetical protein